MHLMRLFSRQVFAEVCQDPVTCEAPAKGQSAVATDMQTCRLEAAEVGYPSPWCALRRSRRPTQGDGLLQQQPQADCWGLAAQPGWAARSLHCQSAAVLTSTTNRSSPPHPATARHGLRFVKAPWLRCRLQGGGAPRMCCSCMQLGFSCKPYADEVPDG